jgi:AraC-like DNA-binding protein
MWDQKMIHTSASGLSLRPSWVKRTIDKSQIAIGTHRGAACQCVGQELLSQAPAPCAPIEALLLRGVLAEVMLRRAVELNALSSDCIDVLRRVAIRPRHDTTARPTHPKVMQALTLMRKAYANQQLRLTDAASAVSLTSCHLSRLLRKETGTGFVDHMRRIRLEKAVTLLRAAQLSVKQVAAEVGYKYAGDLTRHFKAAHGTTPTAWRRRQARRTR